MGTAWHSFVAALGLGLAIHCSAGPQQYGKVQLLRDNWGVPHVFSDTDAGAMYGLGYVTAQERGFQMSYGLRIMQGRLAEVVGPRTKGGRRETAVDSDRKMRTFGWARAATRIAANLDSAILKLLEAYSDGAVFLPAAWRSGSRSKTGACLRDEPRHDPGCIGDDASSKREGVPEGTGQLAVPFGQLRLRGCGGAHWVCDCRSNPGALAVGRCGCWKRGHSRNRRQR